MQQEILDYLKKIKPTKIGVLLLAGMILIIPLLIDFLLRNTDRRITDKFSITVFTLRGFVLILLAIVVYHIIFFMVSIVFKKKRKNNL